MDSILKEASNDEKKIIIRAFLDRATVNRDDRNIKFYFYSIPSFDHNFLALNNVRGFD